MRAAHIRAPVRPTPSSSPLLQRKCSCGGTPGPTGECAECRRKRHLGVQPKLRLGAAGDRWEREADRLADAVARGSGGMDPTGPGPGPVTPVVQRYGGAPEPSSPGSVAPLAVTPVTLRGSGDTGEAPPEVAAALSAPGRPLDSTTRGLMERRFGHDFGNVRLHTDAGAADSARAVSARAYTVGRDVVFGAGEYRPGTAGGLRLLAHELVHTVQQREAPGTVPRAAPAVVQRAPVPSPDAPEGPLTVEQTAARAEASCDLETLCRLHFTNPEVVSKERAGKATRRCRPEIISIGNPCLDPAVMNPDLFRLPPTAGPTKAPAKTKPPAASSGGGLAGLSGLTKFELKLGAATFKVDLPSSARLHLPIEFKKSYKITFELTAKTSGSFTFSVTLDGIPHIQIKATTTTDVGKKSVTSQLLISSARKTCHAPSPQATKKSLEKAGEKLKKAIQDVNKSDARLEAEKAGTETTGSPTPEGFDRVKRLGDVVSGIVGVKRAVDDAQKGCKPKPVISVGITGKAPLDPRADDAVPGSITGGVTIRF